MRDTQNAPADQGRDRGRDDGALVVIVLRDSDDGTVDMHVQTSPPFPLNPDERATPAQQVALLMMIAASDRGVNE